MYSDGTEGLRLRNLTADISVRSKQRAAARRRTQTMEGNKSRRMKWEKMKERGEQNLKWLKDRKNGDAGEQEDKESGGEVEMEGTER